MREELYYFFCVAAATAAAAAEGVAETLLTSVLVLWWSLTTPISQDLVQPRYLLPQVFHLVLHCVRS